METSVNFDNLRNITGGDADVEVVLFSAFLEAAQNCMDKLAEALANGDESAWRHQAHAFKGVCLNLGAEPLSRLCGTAQTDWRACDDEKSAMLQSITSEYANVRRAIDMAMNGAGL